MLYYCVLLKIIAIAICFSANIYGLLYAKQLLPNSKKVIFFALAAAINTAFLFISYSGSFSYYTNYPLAIIMLTIEIFLLSNAKIMQAFFFGTIFALHIVLVQMLIVALLAWYHKIIPLEVRLTETMYYTSICLSFALVGVILFSVRKITPINDIQSISTTYPYSLLVSCITTFIIFYSCIFSLLLMSPVSYPNTTLIIISNSIFSAIFFYFLLMYNVKLNSLGFFKGRVGGLTEKYESRSKHLTDLKKLAFTDSLTGCYSRTYAEEHITKLSQARHINYCVVYIDIDKLKQVNDEFGHKEGDQYIKNMCTTITHHLRSDDILARIGGDEFVLFLNCSTKENAHVIMERIEEHIQQWNHSSSKYPMNISYGIMHVDTKNTQIEVKDLICMADKQMLKHKSKKRRISQKMKKQESSL